MAEPLQQPEPEPDLAALLRQAAAHHQRGELREAEALYRQIIAAKPEHFDALHLYGVLMHQAGEPAAALKLIGAALKTNAHAAPAHSNHGIVLAVLERHQEALESYDRALTLQPDFAEALYNRGNTLHALGRAEEALDSFTRAIALRPDFADALINRAQILRGLGREREALTAIERALKLKPDHAGAHALHGRLLQSLELNEAALASFTRALALTPDDAETLVARGNTHYAMKSFATALADYDHASVLRPDAAPVHANRGNALRALGRHAEALESLDRAIALDPDYAEGRNSRGNALLELNRPAEALAEYDRALALKPDFVDTLVNRGTALRYLDRNNEALASFERALALDSQFAEAHWNKALLCLSLGDFAAGWAEYEWRWRRADAEGARNFPQPQWRGEDITGKTILLHAEQGFGDTIQFARYVPMVAARGARVMLEAPDALMPLLAGLGGVTTLVARGDPLPRFDLHCPLMSLPLAFGTTLATIPAEVPYLRAPDDRVAQWRTRLAGLPHPRVGLVWSGKSTHKNDHNRTIALAQLAPLLALSGVSFVSLQREYRDADLADLAGRNILRLDAELADFAATAAAIGELDLTVSVDTSVAHLAGALGKPVFILLSHVQDWRWLLKRADSPWYPSARLFRQPSIGDWDSAITAVAAAVAQFAAAAH